jgi:hypothetical protein
MKYFFDLVGPQRSEYDYEGRNFSDPSEMFRMAELIAVNLEFEGQWSGWSLDVRDAQGRQVFTIPIRASELSVV